MTEPLTPELEAQAQELAARIHIRSAEVILDMARQLVATREENLFGTTELQLRDKTLQILGDAFAERIPQKVATSGRASTAPAAAAAPVSTTTAKRRS